MKYNQTEKTAIGTKCVSPHACLVVAYKAETKLFPIELPMLQVFLNWRI